MACLNSLGSSFLTFVVESGFIGGSGFIAGSGAGESQKLGIQSCTFGAFMKFKLWIYSVST